MDNSFSKLVEYFRLIDEFNLKGQGVIEYDQQSLSEVNIPDLKEIIIRIEKKKNALKEKI
tara:strand:+ start:209 stop:388 length:180 start_codon:yes stop_codon:yes gene_type:complete